MNYSQIYSKTKRNVAAQDSKNAYFLEKAGYINQIAAGVYVYMPLALRVIKKIEEIIREEMNALGASEVSFSALQPRSTWEKSGRWEDSSFRSIVYEDTESKMTLGPTHEEPMVQVVQQGVNSYRDLPVLLYQFQTKFRKELRAKSGLLRGREFKMKDLYSFHPDQKSHEEFYELAAESYLKIFDRLGLKAYRVKASGGVFSKEFSDEFQVICPTGEDEIWLNEKTGLGYNLEVLDQVKPAERKPLKKQTSIEVGNIFHLGSKYPDAFDFKYLSRDGKKESIIMGCYGIGITRLLGTFAEIFNDDAGLKLPAQIAPFEVMVIDLTESKTGEKITKYLEEQGIEALLDNRDEAAGAKMVEADLIGIPIRLVYSQKTAQEGKVEIKIRESGKISRVNTEDVVSTVKRLLNK